MAPSCQEAGVLGVLPGLVGSIQALETMKLILGAGQPLIGRLAHVDTLAMQIRILRLRKDPKCPMCGENPTITQLIDYEEFCGLRGAHAETDASANAA
jgi:adenylyltransferase/sulfurtransferase